MLLSIDASTKSLGWAIFDGTKLVDYGCITASSTDPIKRIHKVVNELEEVEKKYSIEKIIIEDVRPAKETNEQTHRTLMWLQGEIAIMTHDNISSNIKIEYLTPSEWRSKCGIHTGRGIKRDELKIADIQFVKDTYGITANDDICDAIGIGHAYVNVLDNGFNWA